MAECVSLLRLANQGNARRLTEKCETAIREMHRPIAKSGTATEATITTRFDAEQLQLSHALTLETYEHIAYTDEGTTPFEFQGRISSYTKSLRA
jgi:hypothetical protein